MKIAPPNRDYIIQIVCYLYILLFVYAAVSKLLDFENFQAQLGQSPLLSAFAGWVSWIVPVTELVLSIVLLIKPLRLIALFASYLLMVMFSAYIFIILHYSEFVPCSCGGILEKMTWQQHLAFNLVFCFLAIVALTISPENTPHHSNPRKKWAVLASLVFGTTVAICIMTFLFLQSENIVHAQNNFVRRFPPHVYDKNASLNLKYRDYYFAGATDSIVFLGNYSSPLSILALDYNLKVLGNYKVTLDDYKFPFRSTQIRIAAPYFYLADGTVPCIFKGKISDWKATILTTNGTYFSTFVPVDTTKIAFRGKSSESGENILGTIATGPNHYNVKTSQKLLQKQIDGIFDTDGMLHYNPKLKSLIYLYYYRNQFVVADQNLNLIRRGNTIDTTSHAKIRISELHNGDRKLSAPPNFANKFSATAGNHLYVNSGLRGRFESAVQWKETAVIDVYDIAKKTYSYSLPVYPVNNEKLHAIYATEKRLFFLIDNAIVAYTLNEENQPRH
ncbi:hypothetical protein Q765_13845 [Flavobacterium rivuli WB 3.3-2 = DSM 21788]|uniref:Methylamine utilisation protein MauE domain-containing protein n=1 Tax=Flavobacterium rivuli WB 3.3-2 = DSM 21788 TaxID=1121895 RepID=A0A0A2M0V4_9FLAO|nr:MauE/DoxX family redox-associated membrane protein [Flavobacterium rivuli]KGO85909.1 hypothetical protein Q765_13845 [Flavobacterium rivuli WB 3.3-2 = DSM 21788]